MRPSDRDGCLCHLNLCFFISVHYLSTHRLICFAESGISVTPRKLISLLNYPIYIAISGRMNNKIEKLRYEN